MNPFMQELHGEDIYTSFDETQRPLDLQGWNGDSPLIRNLILERKPKLAVEVGSWKGMSTNTIANAMKDVGHGTLICVDTWLGAIEFWTGSDRFQSKSEMLEKKFGFPQVYWTFLTNMKRQGHTEIVVPFPIPSTMAQEVFVIKKWSPEYIYLDASHEYRDVKNDIELWWQVLAPGGVMLGDDYDTSYWPGVVKAVDEFIADHGLNLGTDGPTWVIRKP
jgi:hypothetical protein